MNETMSPAVPFDRPPQTAGGARRVGVEVEFTGISARTAAAALAAALEGRVAEDDPHAFRIADTSLGELTVELDIRYVHPKAQDESLPVHLGPRLAALLGWAVRRLVPCELVTVPLPLGQLAEVDRAVAILRSAGAMGDGVTWIGSLGLHFNVEPEQLDAAVLTMTLQAFLLLEPWLRQQTLAADGRPRLLPASYPGSFVRRVLSPDYRPDLGGFIEDYLAANPTRDRALDLLPALLNLAPERVRDPLRYEKIKGRPVFHYRLPRAHVARPGWSIAPDWNRWVAVERLAADPDRLGGLIRAFQVFEGSSQAWAERVAA
jgi:hypothetical protein